LVAVINAVAHRDYFERGATVMVQIYDVEEVE
jgi:predicted HTH transcriptional regulator